MYETLRKPGRAKGIIAFFIFGAIILVFIGFGVVPDRMSREAHGVAAVVNRTSISLADFRERVDALEKQYQIRMDQVPEKDRKTFRQMLKQRALEDLIEYEALSQAAMDQGLKIPDEEIRDFIVAVPAFQEEGKFKRDYYERFLQSRGFRAGDFESKIRKDLQLRRIQGVFEDALKGTNIEKEKDKMVRATEIDLEVASLSPDEISNKLKVVDAEVKTFLANAENLAKAKKTFEENAGAYGEPEKIKARHILVKLGTDKASTEKAEKKIKDLAAKVRPENFGEVARQESEDVTTQKSGGDLGYFSKGSKVPEFEKVAFALPANKVSEVVKSDIGYHLILVEDHKAAQTISFDQVQTEVARKLVAANKVADWNSELEKRVAARDESGVRKMLKEAGIELKDAKDVALDASQVPALEDTDRTLGLIMSKGIRHGLVPEVMKSGLGHQVVFVKSLSQNSSGKDEFGGMDFLSSRKSADAFRIWAKDSILKAKVSRNSEIVAE